MSALASLTTPVAVKAGKSVAFNRGTKVAQTLRVFPGSKQSARLSTVRVNAREPGMKTDGTSATGRKPNPAFATEDGKLWVCQGCGYIYDGSVGKWGEAKRCPACGERRFALKTQAEMNIAAGSIAVVAGLIALLVLLVKVA